MRMPKADALRPSELFELLNPLEKNSLLNGKKEISQEGPDTNRSDIGPQNCLSIESPQEKFPIKPKKENRQKELDTNRSNIYRPMYRNLWRNFLSH